MTEVNLALNSSLSARMPQFCGVLASRCMSVTSIDVSGCNLSARNMRDLVGALVNGEAFTKNTLTKLNVSRNPLKELGASYLHLALLHCKKLKVLEARDCEIPDAGVGRLMGGLILDSARLSALNLNGNDFTDDAVREFARMLPQMKSLREAYLCSPRVTPRCLEPLRAAIEANIRIQVIEVYSSWWTTSPDEVSIEEAIQGLLESNRNGNRNSNGAAAPAAPVAPPPAAVAQPPAPPPQREVHPAERAVAPLVRRGNAGNAGAAAGELAAAAAAASVANALAKLNGGEAKEEKEGVPKALWSDCSKTAKKLVDAVAAQEAESARLSRSLGEEENIPVSDDEGRKPGEKNSKKEAPEMDLLHDDLPSEGMDELECTKRALDVLREIHQQGEHTQRSIDNSARRRFGEINKLLAKGGAPAKQQLVKERGEVARAALEVEIQRMQDLEGPCQRLEVLVADACAIEAPVSTYADSYTKRDSASSVESSQSVLDSISVIEVALDEIRDGAPQPLKFAELDMGKRLRMIATLQERQQELLRCLTGFTPKSRVRASSSAEPSALELLASQPDLAAEMDTCATKIAVELAGIAEILKRSGEWVEVDQKLHKRKLSGGLGRAMTTASQALKSSITILEERLLHRQGELEDCSSAIEFFSRWVKDDEAGMASQAARRLQEALDKYDEVDTRFVTCKALYLRKEARGQLKADDHEELLQLQQRVYVLQQEVRTRQSELIRLTTVGGFPEHRCTVDAVVQPHSLAASGYVVNKKRSDFASLELCSIGGEGTQYKATTPEGGIHLIKVYALHTLSELKAFEREVTVLQQMRHELVIPLQAVFFEYDEEQGLLAFVQFPFYEKTLKDICKGVDASSGKRQAIPVAELTRVMGMVVQAVGYLHTSGVIHRSLSTSVVLMRDDGMPVLSGFETSKLQEVAGSSLTSSVCLSKDSPEEVAPEVESGAAPPSHASDMYALGVMIFQLFYGGLALPRARKPTGHLELPTTSIDHLMDLLDTLLHADPSCRLTADEVSVHPFFAGLHAREDLNSSHSKISALQQVAASKYAQLPQLSITIDRRETAPTSVFSQVVASLIPHRLVDRFIERKWRITFQGEDGIDAGALLSAFLHDALSSAMLPSSGLFDEGPLGHMVPKTDKEISVGGENAYMTIGILLAYVISCGRTIDVQFPLSFFKFLLHGEDATFTLSDLDAVDPVLASSMRQLLSFHDAEELGVTFGDLIPNGDSVDVTNDNKKEYVRLVVRNTIMTSRRSNLDRIRRGFCLYTSIQPFLQLFTPFDLQVMLTGERHIVAADIISHLEFSPQVGIVTEQQLVRYLSSISNEDLRAFLHFVTGHVSIPVGGLGPIKVNRKLRSQGLPHAATCFSTISMHSYTTYEELAAAMDEVIGNHKGTGGAFYTS